jgi:hypothetical protein
MSKKNEKKVTGMKVRYLGETECLGRTHGKVYDVISIDTSWETADMYRIIDESDEDYLYSARSFELVHAADT